MSTLFMVNIPYNCTESELNAWVESSGIGVKSIRLIQDTVAGVSPSFAYVELSEGSNTEIAISSLNDGTPFDLIAFCRPGKRQLVNP